MDNFRKNSRPQSIDGFINRRQSPLGAPGDFKAPEQNHHPKPKQVHPTYAIPKVDDFRGIDGFMPGAQPNIGAPDSADHPAELGFDHSTPAAQAWTPQAPSHQSMPPKKAKRRLFGRKSKAKKQHAHPRRRIKRIALIAAAFIFLVGSGLMIRAFLAGRGIFKGGGDSAILNNQDVDPAQLRGEGDGRVNIMVLGKGGAEQHDGPDLTDTIIIASIDPIAKEAALLSIPRDFWVESPSGYKSKINEVYANAKNSALDSYPYKDRDSNEAREKSEKAGIDSLESVLTKTLGVPIHYYAMIDFAGFKKAIDTVGGIDINVTNEMAVKETMWINGRNYNLNAAAGQQHFDGMKALAFSRSRKTSARGDFARSERQRAVIIALKDKILSTGTLANPLKINQLISDFSGQASTDFSVNEILRVYELSKEIPSDKVVSAGLDEYVMGDTINGLSVQIPKAGAFNYAEIQNHVRNIMRDAFLKKEDAKIMVLNGTDTIGLATKKSNELKSFGYNILSVGDAPTATYANTILVDLRSGTNKYTLNYLEKRLNVKAVNTLPDANIVPGAADFVIIVGSNETSSSQNQTR